VEDEMLGVVYEVEPDESAEPPLEAVYQSMVSPAPVVADIETVPVEHLAALPAVGADGSAFTVAVTAVLEADKQPVVVFLASA
jgi:hypothetical protein